MTNEAKLEDIQARAARVFASIAHKYNYPDLTPTLEPHFSERRRVQMWAESFKYVANFVAETLSDTQSEIQTFADAERGTFIYTSTFGDQKTRTRKVCWALETLFAVTKDRRFERLIKEAETLKELDPRGVSLLDAAKIINDDGGDEGAARQKVARWRNTRAWREFSVTSLGVDGKQKLFACTALCDFIEKVDGYLPAGKALMIKRLEGLVRTPTKKS